MSNEKRCNRTMLMGDDHDDNETTIRCQLPMGHHGPHQESYDSYRFGVVTTTFEKGFTPVQMDRLRHMVPSGRNCINSDGVPCPFRAVVGMDGGDGGERELACYLSGRAEIWPSERYRGCGE